jgi:preprotein translocase subunit YajC
MKKQILSEEFRRMQKLAGLITENELNEFESNNDTVAQALKSGEYQEITPDTIIAVGDDVLSSGGNFGEIVRISGDIYVIEYGGYGEKMKRNKKNLMKSFLIRKKN